MKYIPLSVMTHFSLGKGLTQPGQLADYLAEKEIRSCALTDLGGVSGAVQVAAKFKDKKIKPIFGTKLRVLMTGTSNEVYNIFLAKNRDGWLSLLKLSSGVVTTDELKKHAKNLIMISGSHGSLLASEISASDELKIEWKKNGQKFIESMKSFFGDDFYIQIQKCHYLDEVLIAPLRELAAITKTQCVATPDAYYLTKADHDDQRVILCHDVNATLTTAGEKLDNLGNRLFTSSEYYLPSREEMLARGHTEEELNITYEIDAKCENFSILGKSIIPPFACPSGYDQDTYLRQLCRDGWNEKIKGKIKPEEEKLYVDRVKYELETLQGCGLSSYFLIVWDIIRYVKSRGWLIGSGRGSAAGCLVSYLLGITEINPIPYGLIFERFYNAGRNTKDKISPPDIDLDIPKHKRQEIIQYIYNKYGAENCSQIITYTTLQGRGSITAVLNTYGNTSFHEIKTITDNIPDKAKVADDLQVMEEEEGESSLLRWCLENRPEKFKEWCEIKDGKLEGPLAMRFEQAIRLEGTKTVASRHASGIIVAPSNLSNYCAVNNIDGDNIATVEGPDAEAIGLLKLDILGLSLLDKLTGVASILEYGDIDDDYQVR